MIRDLQDKIVTFTKFNDSGQWKGVGTGKVMVVERGERVVVSIRKHPLFKEQELVSLYLWNVPERSQCDVIMKVEEDKK